MKDCVHVRIVMNCPTILSHVCELCSIVEYVEANWQVKGSSDKEAGGMFNETGRQLDRWKDLLECTLKEGSLKSNNEMPVLPLNWQFYIV